MKHVDFFYDFACPYAYLAHERVDAAAARHGATVTWRPFLLGGVFRAIGTPDMPAAHMPEAKARMNMFDMFRWAAFHAMPPKLLRCVFRFSPSACHLPIHADGWMSSPFMSL